MDRKARSVLACAVWDAGMVDMPTSPVPRCVGWARHARHHRDVQRYSPTNRKTSQNAPKGKEWPGAEILRRKGTKNAGRCCERRDVYSEKLHEVFAKVCKPTPRVADAENLEQWNPSGASYRPHGSGVQGWWYNCIGRRKDIGSGVYSLILASSLEVC
jgi:hypothetical protein